jgi:hypothetical protein
VEIVKGVEARSAFRHMQNPPDEQD